MKKCIKCGKTVITVSKKSAWCVDCLQSALDDAVGTLDRLSRSSKDREKVLDEIDTAIATKMANAAEATLMSSKFAMWNKEVHASPKQVDRIKRAASVKIVSYDPITETAIIKGSKNYEYETSFFSCTCGDFVSRRLPCKHMYKVAAAYGGIDFLDFLSYR